MNTSELEKYIADLERQSADSAPLCKPKNIKNDQVVTNVEPITEKEKKPRKPKTQAQLDAFKITLQKRKSAVEQRGLNKKIESAKLLLANEMKKQPVSEPTKHKESDYSSDDSSKDEIVVRKSKKKKSKKIIIVDSDSDSDSGQDVPPTPKKEFGRSHQNKKSAVKIHQPVQTQQKHNSNEQKKPCNFFCD